MSEERSAGAEPVGVGRSCGKVLLMGEHAVVYGHPAIAVGLDDGAHAKARWSSGRSSELAVASWGLAVEADGEDLLSQALASILERLAVRRSLSVELEVHLPVGVGLGSSAAIGVAAVRAIDDLTRERRSEAELGAAYQAWEAVFHGNPSGIDHTAAARGGTFVYRRRPEGALIEAIAPERGARLVMVVAAPGASTKTMVDGVRQRVQTEPQAAKDLASIGALVEETPPFVAAGDWARVGEAMNTNHALLRALGVSCPALDAAVDVARSAGALGAKLTGSGGGGCVVCLTHQGDEHLERVLNARFEGVLCRTLN